LIDMIIEGEFSGFKDPDDKSFLNPNGRKMFLQPLRVR